MSLILEVDNSEKYELHVFINVYRVLSFDAPDDSTAKKMAPEILRWFKIDSTYIGNTVHLINSETTEVLF